MKTLLKISAAALILVGLAAPAAARQNSESASAAATLTSLLDQRNLEAIAARDPDQAGRFVAALYFPGLQLLVVTAVYPAPALLDKQIIASKYSDVYLDLQSAAGRGDQFFVMDLKADGLKRLCGIDEPFDSTSRGGGAHMAFDGKWDAQALSESQYDARFTEDDARYARMLAVLTESLRQPKPAPAPVRKGKT